MTYFNPLGQGRVGWKSGVIAPTPVNVSSLWNSIYSVYNADSVGSSSLKTSLVAAYNGESNTNDSFGTNNGTAVGGLTYTTGKIGNAFNFNGTTSYVGIPNTTDHLNFTGDFSISTWVMPLVTSAAENIYFSNYKSGGAVGSGYTFFLNRTTNKLTFRNYLQTSSSSYEYSWIPLVNTWYHLTVTRKASTGTKLYINGVEVLGTYAAGNATTNPTYQTGQIYNIGGYLNGAGLSNYRQDAVNVWNKELTSAEVTELYNSGNGAQYITDSFYKPTTNDALNTYNGTAQGGLTYGVGKVGTAFKFNGTNSYILLPTASMRFTNSFSAAMWTHTTANQTGNKGLFTNYFYPGHLGYSIYMTTSNKVETYFLGNGNTFNTFTSNSSLANNQWNHIVVLWDKPNTQWKIYINGVLDYTYTNANASALNYGGYGSERTNIGAINSSPSNGVANVFNGSIDAFNVWNKVLTQSEITELYNSGNGKQYPN